jgi:ABC-type glutathione transport system ATPase component
MAVILYKSIAGYRQHRRAAAAAPGEQQMAPDGPPSAQEARPGTPRSADASAAASAGVPYAPARGGPAGTAAVPRLDGQAAKVVEAVSREPAARIQERTGQVSRPAVIEVRGLRKSYDGVEAVAGIDLEVRAGEIFAFLGPNGAGKTTTVEILEGYRRRTGGDVAVLGADPARQAGTGGRASAWSCRSPNRRLSCPPRSACRYTPGTTRIPGQSPRHWSWWA